MIKHASLASILIGPSVLPVLTAANISILMLRNAHLNVKQGTLNQANYNVLHANLHVKSAPVLPLLALTVSKIANYHSSTVAHA